MTYIYIAGLGVLGIFVRYFSNFFFQKLNIPLFYSTFFVNSFGSFLIGAIYVLAFEKNIISTEVRTGLMVGLFGGLTTFSTFSLELFQMFQKAQYGLAFGYMFLSCASGLITASIGVFAARFF